MTEPEVPAWARSLVVTLEEMRDGQREQQLKLTALETELALASQARNTPPPSLDVPGGLGLDLPSRDGSPALGSTERPRLRPTLPDPPCFDGKRSNFPTWLLEIGNKLDTDGAAIGTHEAQFAYVYARLDSTLQKMAAAYV